MRLLVISGLSGSGKSIALQALEDLDFYCVDNLPVGLLPEFSKLMIASDKQHNAEGIAVGIDARNVADDLQYFQTILGDIKKLGIACEIIFLEANDGTLLKRFSETRRKHPLTSDTVPLVEAISKERELLRHISVYADLHIDTSHTNVHQLRDLIRERAATKAAHSLSILFVSFGYKHGIPADADFVFDVRCLPNPYWDPQLRLLTGKDTAVIQFLDKQEDVMRMFESMRSFLDDWIPKFQADNRSYMTIAIGCTGGQHRSVYLVNILSTYFKNSYDSVLTRHRELL